MFVAPEGFCFWAVYCTTEPRVFRLDVGRRPELKSDETCDANVIFVLIGITITCNITFVFETAKTSGAVIGGATQVALGTGSATQTLIYTVTLHVHRNT